MTEREQFLAERQLGVGGSDAASLFGLGFGCTRRLFYDKTAAKKDFEFEQTRAIRLGSLMEPFFAAEYATETGNTVDMRATFVQETAAPIAVHIDAWVHARNREMGVAEIKSCGRGAWHKYRREGLPDDYSLQLQTGMGAAGKQWGVFIIGCRDSGEILHWEVNFNHEIYAEVKAAARSFWETLKHPTNPIERLEPDDKRCASCSYRTTCQGEHISLAAAGLTAKDGYEMDDSLLPLLIERAERSELRKQAEDLFQETNETIKAQMGERKLVCTEQGHKVQYYEIQKKDYIVKAHVERPLRVFAPKGEKSK